MLPRPLLTHTFALTYRKIPVLAIGREIYCDTSLIIEALEHYFPKSEGWGSVYPGCEGLGEWVYKGVARGFASFWVDVSWLMEERFAWEVLIPRIASIVSSYDRSNPPICLALLLRHRPRPTYRA